MKKLRYVAGFGLVLCGCLLYLLLSGEQQAARVRESVVRFHVVANSGSAADQQRKLQVRDGLFAYTQSLFAECSSQQEVLAVAEGHRAELEAEAERILRQQGCNDPVTLVVGEQYFPTKQYGTLSFPAGRYRALSVQIGAAEGRNFWCVLYPALCIAPAVAAEEAEKEIGAVTGKDPVSFLQKERVGHRIRFALVEWFEELKQKYRKR